MGTQCGLERLTGGEHERATKLFSTWRFRIHVAGEGVRGGGKVVALPGSGRPEDAQAWLAEKLATGDVDGVIVFVSRTGENVGVDWCTRGGVKQSYCAFAGAQLLRWATDEE